MRKNAVLPKALGRRVQKRREELGLTQFELATKVNVSRVYMGYIEQGRATPSLEVVEKIAKALRTPMSSFF